MRSQHPFPENSRLRELRQLVSKLCDQQLTVQEWSRIKELVSTCPNCSEYYVSSVCLHASLPGVMDESKDRASTLLKRIQDWNKSKQEGNDLASDDEETCFQMPCPQDSDSSESLADDLFGNNAAKEVGASPAGEEPIQGFKCLERMQNVLGVDFEPPLVSLESAPDSVTSEFPLVDMQSESSSKGCAEEESSRLLDTCFRTMRLSRLSSLVSIVVLAAVTAVFAGERLYTYMVEVLLPPSQTVADERSGLVAGGDRNEFLLSGPNQQSGTRRVGSSHFKGVALTNLLMFPLPGLGDLERLDAARIEWTYKQKDRSPDFAIDLYGLGFVEPSTRPGFGFWEGEEDDSYRVDYEMEGKSHRKVVLIEQAVMNSNTKPGRVSIENSRLLEFLHSLYDDGAKEGDLVVFRLNADKSTIQAPRSTGYRVVYPPATNGMTKPTHMPMLQLSAKRGLPVRDYSDRNRFVMAQAASADWSSGLVTSSHARTLPGCNRSGVRRVGSSRFYPTGLGLVFVFSLPSVEQSASIESTSLEWTLKSLQGTFDYSVDLYGLGFTSEERFDSPCYWEGDIDPTFPEELGLRGPSGFPVTLIRRGVMTPDSQPGRIEIEGGSLKQYIESLYRAGAKGGDLVVFRLNVDSSTHHLDRLTGFNVVQPPSIPGSTTSSELPLLRVTSAAK